MADKTPNGPPPIPQGELPPPIPNMTRFFPKGALTDKARRRIYLGVGALLAILILFSGIGSNPQPQQTSPVIPTKDLGSINPARINAIGTDLKEQADKIQAAIEKEAILLTDVPASYVQISSGLGSAAPTNIFVVPVLFEGQVKAVIELASLKPGDFNQDGYVTAADVSAMESAMSDLKSYESTTGFNDTQLNTLGDLNHDNVINGADLQMLLGNLVASGGSTTPVPEPSSLALLSLACVSVLGGRRFLATDRRRLRS